MRAGFAMATVFSTKYQSVWKPASMATHSIGMSGAVRSSATKWQGGEISIAGGVAGQFFEDAKSMTTPYATATWLMQY